MARTPEERAAAKEKANERAEASLKRRADKASKWAGFSTFWSQYPHPPTRNTMLENGMKIASLFSWESGRPSVNLINAIMLTLRFSPKSTLDPKTGRQLTAMEFLMLMWPGPTPEQFRRLLSEPEYALELIDHPEENLRNLWDPAELQALVNAARLPGPEGP